MNFAVEPGIGGVMMVMGVRMSVPLVMSISCRRKIAFFTEWSGLVQQTTYIRFVFGSITGVLRILHRKLIPQRSISVVLGKPGCGFGAGLIGCSSDTGWF